MRLNSRCVLLTFKQEITNSDCNVTCSDDDDEEEDDDDDEEEAEEECDEDAEEGMSFGEEASDTIIRACWCGVVVRVSDLQPRGRRFESRPLRFT